MEGQITNQQKHLNYREQNERLIKAIKNQFYLEAIFIEYSIIEDRTESILRYTNRFPKQSSFVSLDKKISLIEKVSEEKASVANQYFDVEFLEKIRDWKNMRNAIIHALMKRNVCTNDLLETALAGRQLVKDLCRISTNYKRKLLRMGLLSEEIQDEKTNKKEKFLCPQILRPE